MLQTIKEKISKEPERYSMEFPSERQFKANWRWVKQFTHESRYLRRLRHRMEMAREGARKTAWRRGMWRAGRGNEVRMEK